MSERASQREDGETEETVRIKNDLDERHEGGENAMNFYRSAGTHQQKGPSCISVDYQREEAGAQLVVYSGPGQLSPYIFIYSTRK